MKNLLFTLLMFISLAAFAQMQVDKKIEMTGATPSDRKVENIEEVINNHDAVNKIYVDTAIANRAASGSSSNMDFTFTASPNAVYCAIGSNTLGTPVTLNSTYVSGLPSSVAISVSGLPAGVTMNVTPGGGFPSFGSILVFYVSGSAVAGTYTLTVTANGGVVSPSQTITLTLTNVKRVFITSAEYKGNLGGLTGADAICQSHADGASLGGNWKAWLSTGTSAKSRLVQHTVPFVLVNGTTIANDWADLTDGTLQNRLNVDEFGNTTPAGDDPYTNTTIDGSSASSNHCNNWTNGTSNTVYGLKGNPYNTGSQWTHNNLGNCHTQDYRLYCFEQ